MRNVYFVRHGETVWNVENKICGATESALTERGREQARAIGREIKARMEAGELQIDRMLCSPLSRARDTAQEIADILELPLAVEPRLREQNFGIWEGTARDGEGFQRAKENFIDSFGTGESMLRLAQRIYNLLDDVRADADHTPAGRTQRHLPHGGVVFPGYGQCGICGLRNTECLAPKLYLSGREDRSLSGEYA